MEYSDISKLIEDMGNSKLTSIDIEFPDGIKIKMEKKEEKIVVKESSEIVEKVIEPSTTVKEIVNTKIDSNDNVSVINTEENGKIITSPMIGTFYAKPSPDSNPYVEIGSVVKKGDTVCIIEAMKLMNEIETEFEGKITEILVKDGDMVEYGKPLFRVV